jgi:hypothetical protein
VTLLLAILLTSNVVWYIASFYLFPTTLAFLTLEVKSSKNGLILHFYLLLLVVFTRCIGYRPSAHQIHYTFDGSMAWEWIRKQEIDKLLCRIKRRRAYPGMHTTTISTVDGKIDPSNHCPAFFTHSLFLLVDAWRFIWSCGYCLVFKCS